MLHPAFIEKNVSHQSVSIHISRQRIVAALNQIFIGKAYCRLCTVFPEIDDCINAASSSKQVSTDD